MSDVIAIHGIIIAGVLFAIGLVGVMVRRNLIFILLSIEIMLNGANLALIAAGSRWGQADAQVMFLLVLTVAATEAAVGLALVFQISQRLKTLNADALDTLRG